MTKLRPPVSFELALTRVAGVLGWEKMAEISGQSDRTVRNWSEPDTRPPADEALTLAVALALDLAYRAAGGQGAPMLHCFATRLEAEGYADAPDAAAIARVASLAAKESGDAVAAMITASLPGADLSDLVVAERESEEAVRAHTQAVAAIRARRHAHAGISAPEVAPPPVIDSG